ncbi:alanine/glycine:cation symporter family protein [Ketobacter sp.]|uniref:alanine/glycine:cation symporter family protein n=1 Tax=Ketobacter sp. TaxID=2083498 RepID=UPI000F22E567|nr:sodium:alanine symporter family protein [Ketobacter sp.]RLU00407.1 MAG: sodium:alanine symporter family protein [Ketobacter sp.]
MQNLTEFLSWLSGNILWGAPMLIALSLTGIVLTLGLRLATLRKIPYAFGLLMKGRKSAASGDIPPFSALMTAMSATVGTGNIAGVATAIAMGGPGALFWMWCIALIGMATKYSEAVLAVRFREQDDRGNFVGGPMYYIKNGMGKNWAWLGTLFALFGLLAGFGIGNTVQSNSVADALDATYDVPHGVTGAILAIIAGLVLLGGIKRIGQVASKLVPTMAILYVATGLVFILINLQQVPAAVSLIVDSAFNGHSAVGGFAGAGIMAAIRFGVARGVFSNEAGLGSAPIAHAAAQTNNPVQQGFIAMLGTFIDTLIICSITGLVIVMSGAWTSGASGAELTQQAFDILGYNYGAHVVALGLALFAFTTILGWSYYSERCAEYLFGTRVIMPFRLLWILAIPAGALLSLDFVWLLADVLNAMMAIPNLIALLVLCPLVFKLTKEYFDK